MDFNTIDLRVWCFECINDKPNDPIFEENSKEAEKGCYIESKITNEYIKYFNNEKQKKSNKNDDNKTKLNSAEKKKIFSQIRDKNILINEEHNLPINSKKNNKEIIVKIYLMFISVIVILFNNKLFYKQKIYDSGNKAFKKAKHFLESNIKGVLL